MSDFPLERIYRKPRFGSRRSSSLVLKEAWRRLWANRTIDATPVTIPEPLDRELMVMQKRMKLLHEEYTIATDLAAHHKERARQLEECLTAFKLAYGVLQAARR